MATHTVTTDHITEPPTTAANPLTTTVASQTPGPTQSSPTATTASITGGIFNL